MAYTSRGYQRNWTYDASADNFDARVGKILSGGLDLQTSLRTKALDELARNKELEALAASRKPASASMLNSRAPDTRRPTGPVDTTGYVWVDGRGESLGPVGGGGSQRDAAAATSGRGGGGGAGEGGDATTGTTGTIGSGGVGSGSGRLSGRRPQMTERQAACLALNTTERSMHLWRRLNPGCVEESTRMPRSTFRDHFGPKADAPEADRVDKEHFFKKTDFSEYTEVKLKIMNQLKS